MTARGKSEISSSFCWPPSIHLSRLLKKIDSAFCNSNENFLGIFVSSTSDIIPLLWHTPVPLIKFESFNLTNSCGINLVICVRCAPYVISVGLLLFKHFYGFLLFAEKRNLKFSPFPSNFP